jgi:hypothetical protein
MGFQYGVLRARPDRAKPEDGGSTAHLQIRAVDASGQPWRGRHQRVVKRRPTSPTNRPSRFAR